MHDFCRGLLADAGIPLPEAVKVKDGNLLQLLGTEWGRNTIDVNVWVKLAQHEVQKLAARSGAYYERMVFIFGDCRFPNELEAFPDALTVRLDAPAELRKTRAEMWRENEKHASEIGLDTAAALGQFKLYFNTDIQTPEFCAARVLEALDEKQ
jgi:hypothetical protein